MSQNYHRRHSRWYELSLVFHIFMTQLIKLDMKNYTSYTVSYPHIVYPSIAICAQAILGYAASEYKTRIK